MKKVIFWSLTIIVPALVSGILLELAARTYYYHRYGPHDFALQHLTSTIYGLVTGMPGETLASDAWNETFLQAGEVPPEHGPRDGFMGARANPKNVDCGYLLICERDQFIEGLVEIKDNGLEYAGRTKDGGFSVLIVGGSVAWGAYASSIESTYFNVLQTELERQHENLSITVLARGGARSDDDLAAFVLRGKELDPDLVVFLNGLNDIYIPSHEGLTLDARKYIRNTEMARRIAEERGIPFAVVLQPFIHGKKEKSKFEKAILVRVSTAGYPDEEDVESARSIIRDGLNQIANESVEAYFVDCSTSFDNESASIFSDHWHFSDMGHQLLAECIEQGLEPVIAEITK